MPDAVPASDETYLRRVAAGDTTAMQRCIDRYGGMVWSLARRMSPTPADAEDAVQEIFIELWKKAESFDPAVAGEPTFVAMIARRRLVDRFRRTTRRPAAEPLDGAVEPAARPEAVGGQMELTDEAARAAELMKQLSDGQFQVLKLSIYGGLSYPDIAERLGIPLGTVKTHARRGLLRLRELLDVPTAAAEPQTTEGRP